MDPLSITTAVVALLTCVFQVTTSITEVIGSTKTAPTVLLEINQSITSFRIVLERLRRVLKDEDISHVQDDEEKSKYHNYDGDMKQLLKACNPLMLEIQKKTREAGGVMRSGLSFEKIKSTLSWQSLQKELQGLRTRLEYSKSSILMLLQLRTLEVLQIASNTSNETNFRIKELTLEVQSLKAQLYLAANAISWRTLKPNRARLQIGYQEESVQYDFLRLGRDQHLLTEDPEHQNISNLGESDEWRVHLEYMEITSNPFTTLNEASEAVCNDPSQETFNTLVPQEQNIKVHSNIGDWLSTFRDSDS